MDFHKFFLHGTYVLLDVNSGAVHVVDKLVYDVLDFFRGDNDEEVLAQLQTVYSREDLTEAMAELRGLIAQGQLFSSAPEISPAMFQAEPIVKALCLHVAHDCNLGDNVIMVASSGIAGEVELGNWVTLGGGTIVHQFVRIGNHAFLGGGSKVRMDVPPFIKADREPLAYMGINSVGLERRGFTKEKMRELHEIYRAYFNMGMNGSKALEYIEAGFPSTPERDYILEFIRKSERGVIRGR